MTSNQLAKPDELIHPKDKNKAWCLQTVQYLYSNYSQGGSGFCDRSAISERRKYAIAAQDIRKYKEKIKCDEDNKGMGDVPIDFTPLPLLVKYWQIVVEMILQQTGTIDINAIDPISVSQKQESQNRIKVNALLQEQFAALEAELGTDIVDKEAKETPTGTEELEIYLMENSKLSAERDFEDVSALVKERSNYKELLERFGKALTIDGLGAYKICINDMGFLTIEGIDSEMLLAPYSDHSNFDNMEYAGYVQYVENTKILNFLQKNENLTLDDAKQVLSNQKQFLSTGQYNYGDTMYRVDSHPQINGLEGKSPVACFFWKSLDRKLKGVKKDENGNTKIEDLDDAKIALEKAQNKFDESYDELLEDTTEYVYYSEWILGTEYQMKYGKMNNQPRDAMYPQLTRLPIRIAAPIMENGVFQSFISLVMPIYDRIMEAYLKLQDNIARSIPKGLAINVGALREVVLSGETKLSPKDVIKYFVKTGNLPYEGNEIPFHELENGIGQSVIILNNLMMQWHAMLKEMSGINEAVDGSSPSSELGMGVMKQMVANSNSALSAYRRAVEAFEKNVVQDIIDLAPMAAEANPKQFIIALGDRTTEFLKTLKEPRSFGLKLTPNLTNKEWQEYLELAKQSIGASPEHGGMTYADYLQVRQLESAKQVASMVRLYITKAQRKYQQMQQESIKANTEAQKESAAMASKLKIQEAQALAEIDLMIEASKHKMKMQLEEFKAKMALEKAKMDNDTREEVAVIKADADITRAKEDSDGWENSADITRDGEIEVAKMNNDVKLTLAAIDSRTKLQIAAMKPKPTTPTKR